MQATAFPALQRTPSRNFGTAPASAALTPAGTPEKAAEFASEPSPAQTPDRTPERRLVRTLSAPRGPVKASPSPLPLPRGIAEAAAAAEPPPAHLRERRARPPRDGAIELLWGLVFAVGVQQLRQAHEFPLDRASRAGWTWCALDLALGLLLRGLMNAVTDRVDAWREGPGPKPEPPAPPERSPDDRPPPLEGARRRDSRAVTITLGDLPGDRPRAPAAELESLLEKANAQPRSTHELREWVRQITDLQRRHPKAIGPGEAAWAASRLSQGALTLPASAAEADMAAFAQAAECLLTPAKEAHRHQRITPEELQMASDHLERQVFERLAQSPPALRGAALAQVRLQMDAPR